MVAGLYIKRGGVVYPAATVEGHQGDKGDKGDKGDAGGFNASTVLGFGTDLNTVTTPGRYYVGTTQVNVPESGVPGHLDVMTTSDRTAQIFTTTASGAGGSRQWVRSATAGVWFPWVRTSTFHGVGSPEGVQVASVGSEYVDSAATNGAIKWIKATGTGATGWRVAVGDTGWRQVASLLLNGNTMAGLLLRRVNSQVSLLPTSLLNATARTSDWFWPNGSSVAGFRLNKNIVPFVPARGNDSHLTHVGTTAGSGGVFYVDAGHATLYAVPAMYWTTDDTWPTTLPGTPA